MQDIRLKLIFPLKFTVRIIFDIILRKCGNLIKKPKYAQRLELYLCMELKYNKDNGLSGQDRDDSLKHYSVKT